MTLKDKNQVHPEEFFQRRYRSWLIIVFIFMIVTGLPMLGILIQLDLVPELVSVLYGHFPAVVGVPFSAAVAFLVVAILRSSEGPIEFEGLSFKFKGASGPVVLWVFCYLAIASSIRMLWPLTGLQAP